MLKNYLKVTIRNLYNNKVYSLINIGGLCVGITTAILILLWVGHELSYDRYHTQANNLYRTIVNWNISGQRASYITTPAPFADLIKQEFPEIKATTRFALVRKGLLTYENIPFGGNKGTFTDPDILQMFSFDFIKGDPKNALNSPNSIAISETLARKIFGAEEAIDKVVKYNNSIDLVVSGIFKDMPDNSHLTFDFLIPFQQFISSYNIQEDNWSDFNYYTYVLLDEKTTGSAMQEKITALILERFKDDTVVENVELQPVVDIHLHSKYGNDISGNGDIQYVYIFSGVAFFILFIACINFMNLATARSVKRAKEIGLRKTVGAGRAQLITQFLGEAFLFTLIAITIAAMLVELLLPIFNEIAQKSITFSLLDTNILIILGLILLFTTLAAGLYPAVVLSSFQPAKVLKGTFKSGGNAVFLRKGLVVIQFLLSIVLLVGTLVVNDQLTFIQQKKLGYNKENILILPLVGEVSSNSELFKQQLLAYPDISNVTTASQDITNVNSSTSGASWNGRPDDFDIILNQLSVDRDFIKTFNIRMVEGRGFSSERESDSVAYILNQTAVNEMGLKDPVGTAFSVHGIIGTVIGVSEDFNFQSIHNPIGPLVLFVSPNWRSNMYISIEGDNISEAVAFAENKWKEINPAYPFEYSFLDEGFDNLYRSELRTGTLFDFFTLVAIFISCLGLYGLASYTAELRFKEIGVRKVMGASISSIFIMFSKDYIKLVLIAFVLACPVAYLLMDQWLEAFAYKTSINPMIFLMAILFAIILTILTVGYQSIRAALANPVHSLRSE